MQGEKSLISKEEVISALKRVATFEKDSRSFAEHGHDPKGCDMIVCWRHNWKACPKEIMVLELRKAMRMRGQGSP